MEQKEKAEVPGCQTKFLVVQLFTFGALVLLCFPILYSLISYFYLTVSTLLFPSTFHHQPSMMTRDNGRIGPGVVMVYANLATVILVFGLLYRKMMNNMLVRVEETLHARGSGASEKSMLLGKMDKTMRIPPKLKELNIALPTS